MAHGSVEFRPGRRRLTLRLRFELDLDPPTLARRQGSETVAHLSRNAGRRPPDAAARDAWKRLAAILTGTLSPDAGRMLLRDYLPRWPERHRAGRQPATVRV